MSKRCELQKEYYKSNGNYKGKGKYCDKYVSWLEDKVLSFYCQRDIEGESKCKGQCVHCKEYYSTLEK